MAAWTAARPRGLAVRQGRALQQREGEASGLDGVECGAVVVAAHDQPVEPVQPVLVITPKTASHHIEHIYAKIDASSRAAAAMFAVQHGLLPEEKIATAATA